MLYLFKYNWQVRDEWFELYRSIPSDELLKKRIGGAGSFLETLFHIIVVEHSWICDLSGKPDFEGQFSDYNSLEKVKELSEEFHTPVAEFLSRWDSSLDTKPINVKRADGSYDTFTYGEILRHVIAHEIHHIGQLSVWSRELGIKPVSANLIGRGLFKDAMPYQDMAL